MEFNLAGRISPKWEVFWNHTWIPDAKIDRSNVVLAANGGGAQVQGDRPASRPSTAAACGAPTPSRPRSVQALVFYRGKQNPEGSRAVYASGFGVVDAMVEYAIDDKTSVKLNVNNLFDKVYADGLYRGFTSLARHALSS